MSTYLRVSERVVILVGVAFGSAPYENPIVFTSNSRGAAKAWEPLRTQGQLVRMQVARGTHTLKPARCLTW